MSDERMLPSGDVYRSRADSRPRLLPRRDPVVHAPSASDGPLDAESLARFDRDGFLVVPGWLRAREVRAALDDLDRLRRAHAGRHEGVIREPGSGAVRSVFAVHGMGGTLAALCRSPRLVAIARQILADDDESLATLVREGGIVGLTGPAGSLLVFDCNLMHGSGSNITPWPRSNLFVVYNARSNALVAPFCGLPPRPEFVASRDFTPLRGPARRRRRVMARRPRQRESRRP